MHTDEKEGKRPLFADMMIMHMEIPKKILNATRI